MLRLQFAVGHYAGAVLSTTSIDKRRLPLLDVGKLVEELAVLLLDKLKLTLHGVASVERLDVVRLRGQLLVVKEVRMAQCRLATLAVGYLHYLLEKPLVLLIDLVLLAYINFIWVTTRTFLVAGVELRGFEGRLMGVAGREDARGRGVAVLPGPLLRRVDDAGGGVGGRCFLREQLLRGCDAVHFRDVQVVGLSGAVEARGQVGLG